MMNQIKQVKLANQLNDAKTIGEVFEIVKKVIIDTFSIKRKGLTIALGNLDTNQNNIILGGYYSPMENTIVVNKEILDNIKSTNKNIYNSYLFHVLLHEYLHSLGFMDEQETRKLAFLISNNHLGLQHDATRIALDPGFYIRNMMKHNDHDWVMQDNIIGNIEKLRKEIDRTIVNYIG